MITLTELEAYQAMFAFLEKYYQVTKSDEIGGLLGSMSTLVDGKTADPAIWQDWLECVELAQQEMVNTELRLNADE